MLIVCCERISQDDRLLSLSTITWRLAAASDGTVLSVTDQVTALGGPQMVNGSRVGLGAALSNLDRWLARPTGHVDIVSSKSRSW